MRHVTAGAAVVLAMVALGIAVVVAEDDPIPELLELEDVSFPHQLHFDDFEIECSECHHGTDAAKLEIPHPAYFEDFWIDCQICHQAQAAPRESLQCSSCHPDAPFSIADETRSAKVVIHQSCWKCHEVGTGAEASANCRFCHSRQVTVTQEDAGDGASG